MEVDPETAFGLYLAIWWKLMTFTWIVHLSGWGVSTKKFEKLLSP